ncbi:hypothetical protein HQ563_14035 [bacterium]|nr:hypothetical protein [bacterium]
MYIPLGPRLLLTKSSDGLTFHAVRVLDLGGSVSDTIAANGGYRMYFHRNPGTAGFKRLSIWSAFSKDGREWTVEDGPRLTASADGPDRLGVGDPAVIRLADGTYRMFYKSFINEPASSWFPRPGARPGPQPAPRSTVQPGPRLGIRPPHHRAASELEVEFIDSSYKVAEGNVSGWFSTGQQADIVLSAIDFNNTGGPLLFNHNAGIASDGTRLLLADRNNNRALVWESLPESNVEPTMVLGQKDSTSNNPGAGPDQMNWPVSVSAADDRVVVADTYNHRVLIWNSFPNRNGQPDRRPAVGNPRKAMVERLVMLNFNYL